MNEKIIHVRIDKRQEPDNIWSYGCEGIIYPVIDCNDEYYQVVGNWKEFKETPFILKEDCTIIDLRPGKVIDGIRWYSILDKDLPEVQALIGKEVYFSDNPFHIAPNKRTLEIINHNGFSYLSVVWPFIGIPEKPEAKIPDENTPKDTLCYVYNEIGEMPRKRHLAFVCHASDLPYACIIKGMKTTEGNRVSHWKYAEIIEEEDEG